MPAADLSSGFGSSAESRDGGSVESSQLSFHSVCMRRPLLLIKSVKPRTKAAPVINHKSFSNETRCSMNPATFSISFFFHFLYLIWS